MFKCIQVPATGAESDDAVFRTALMIARRIAPGDRDPVDVLVAAASGGALHGRLREVVFGGFTRRVPREASLPVLMAH